MREQLRRLHCSPFSISIVNAGFARGKACVGRSLTVENARARTAICSDIDYNFVDHPSEAREATYECRVPRDTLPVMPLRQWLLRIERTRSKLAWNGRFTARNLRLQPMTAFSRFAPVHSADLEGQQRVEFTPSRSHRRMPGFCAFLPSRPSSRWCAEGAGGPVAARARRRQGRPRASMTRSARRNRGRSTSWVKGGGVSEDL
jgi:hypothetical protein